MVGEHRMEFVPLSRDLALRVGVDLDRPFVAWAGVEDAPRSRGKRSVVINGRRKRLVGMGGLYWREGLCWLWLGNVLVERTSAVRIVRAARKMLAKAEQMGEIRVLAARDPHPFSAKLLLLLGFTKLADHPLFGGIEIWEHRLVNQLRKAA